MHLSDPIIGNLDSLGDAHLPRSVGVQTGNTFSAAIVRSRSTLHHEVEDGLCSAMCWIHLRDSGQYSGHASGAESSRPHW